jgi:hypothetical protein
MRSDRGTYSIKPRYSFADRARPGGRGKPLPYDTGPAIPLLSSRGKRSGRGTYSTEPRYPLSDRATPGGRGVPSVVGREAVEGRDMRRVRRRKPPPLRHEEEARSGAERRPLAATV